MLQTSTAIPFESKIHFFLKVIFHYSSVTIFNLYSVLQSRLKRMKFGSFKNVYSFTSITDPVFWQEWESLWCSKYRYGYLVCLAPVTGEGVVAFVYNQRCKTW